MPSPFTHAVASFDPTARSVLLWTRLPGRSSTRWVIATDPALESVVAQGEAPVRIDADETVLVDVEGLDPATTYFYRFDCGADRSPVGRTRTLPADPGARVRLGLVSCARYSVAPFGVYRAVAEREVDLVVHLGDYIYEDDGSKGVRDHEPPHEAVTLDDYRLRIGQARRDRDCTALHLRHPMVTVLDDHDVADNCWATGAKKHDEAELGPWSDRVEAALRARQEWLPARRPEGEGRRTWRAMALGGVGELVLLDTRLAGRDQHAGDEGTKRLRDEDRSLLGAEQRRWLADRLADVSKPWSIVVSGVVVNEVALPVPATTLLNPLLPNGYQAVEGHVIHDDQWDGYPAERDRLVVELGKRMRAGGRAVLLSGDVHASWAFEGPHDEDGRAVAVEVTAPAVASKPMGRGRIPGTWRALDALVGGLQHAPWVDVSRRGYALLDIGPDDVTAEWWFVEASDLDPTAGAERGATLRSPTAASPPKWEEAAALVDPVRPTSTEPPPPRPDDLPRLRRAHLVRSSVARSLGAAAIIGTIAATTHLFRRSR